MKKYDKRLELTMTADMHAALVEASTRTGAPVTAIIRQAIHDHLDGQRRLEDWLIILTFITSSEFAHSRGIKQPRQLFDNAVGNFARYAEAIRAAFNQREGEERIKEDEEDTAI